MNLQRTSSVLEVVSYWNDTLLDIDHIQAENGYRFQLEPDMQAILKRGDGATIESQDAIIEMGRQDILHVKQGNLNFVFAYVNIPGVTLPRITQRDDFAWLVLLFSFFLYCTAATLIYLTQVTQRPDDDWKPWLELSKPLTIEIAPKAAAKPKITATKPVAPRGRALEPPAPATTPGAAGPAPGPSLRDLGRIRGLGSSLPLAPTPFQGAPAGSVGQAKSKAGMPGLSGIGANGPLNTTTSGDAAGSMGQGKQGSMDNSIGSGFEPQGRAAVGLPMQNPVLGDDGLNPSEVQAIIRTHLNEIRHCYEQALQKTPGLNGRVKMNFVVGGVGQVTSARIVEDTIHDADLGTCISSKILRWDFPAPRNNQPVNVSYPFLFVPR